MLVLTVGMMMILTEHWVILFWMISWTLYQLMRKKTKKKKKCELDSLILDNNDTSQMLVEHKVHKKKKKSKKAANKERKAEFDLLGLDQEDDVKYKGINDIVGSNDNLKVEVCKDSFKIVDQTLNLSMNLTNIGSKKISNIKLSPQNGTQSVQTTLTKSLKPGVSKSKCVDIRLEDTFINRITVYISCEGLADLACHLVIPASSWLVTATIDAEKYAELLIGGKLAFMSSKQIVGSSIDFNSAVALLVNQMKLTQVELQGHSASLYGESNSGSKLAFLAKESNGSTIVLEGRGEDKSLLASILDQAEEVLKP